MHFLWCTADHLYWIAIVLSIGYKIMGGSLFFSPSAGGARFSSLSPIIAVLYVAFAYTSFITYQSRVKTFFKGIGVYLVSELLFVIFFSAVALIVILLLAWLSPDTFESIRPSLVK